MEKIRTFFGGTSKGQSGASRQEKEQSSPNKEVSLSRKGANAESQAAGTQSGTSGANSGAAAETQVLTSGDHNQTVAKTVSAHVHEATVTPPAIRKKTPMKGATPVGTNRPQIYQPPLKVLKEDAKKRIAVHTIGKENPNYPAPGKVLMVVGATGSGKSTAINGLTNYIYGVDWDDDFRYKLIVDEGGRSQTESQTSWITAYVFYKTENSIFPHTLTVIDTPGFGDTRGIQRDKEIAEQIKELFSNCQNHVVDQLHAIAFVAPASAVRLTATQRYIFDATLSIFGKDIESNILLLATFADGQKPPVYQAASDAKIPYRKAFKFNNSALYSENASADNGSSTEDDDSSFNQQFWTMGVKSFATLFNELITMDARSLHLTREVLKQRDRLEASVSGLQPQIQKGLAKIDVLKQECIILEQKEAEINDNKNFTYTVKDQRQITVPLKSGELITNCRSCHTTCHFPCGIANNADKRGCAVIDSEGNCTVCPKKCTWQIHENTPYRYDIQEVMVEKTYGNLKAKYESALQGKSNKEGIIHAMEAEMQQLNVVVFDMIDEARMSLERLKEIALKPNPMTEVEYIDLLIESEKQEGKPSFMERIKALEEIRNRAVLLSKVAKEGVKTPGSDVAVKKGWREMWGLFS